VLAPAAIDENIRKEAQDIAIKCMEAIDGIGIFGVEMFLTTENEILVNEIAPRPHNSGHYTIEGCYTSQFENGLRAILGLPLGSTEMVKPAAVMINLLGERTGVGTPTSVKGFLSHDKAKLHLYSKESSRPGRKMGHITLVGDDIEEVRKDARLALDAFKW
jgi:5-(carboxyamino)imidazole ribonucleotide synthase